MKKLVIVIGILMLGAVVAYPVFAHGPGWGRGGQMWGNGGGSDCSRYDGRGFRGTTEEQQAKLDELDQKFFNETADLRGKIWSKRAELGSLLNAQNPDENKIRALQKEISTLKGQMAEKRLTYRLEARKTVPGSGGYDRGNGRGHGKGYGGYGGNYGPRGCRR